MISKKITAQHQTIDRFDVGHQDIVNMLNEPNVLNQTVASDEVFYLYMITPTGKEIFLREISMSETLSIEVFRQTLESSPETILDVDVIGFFETYNITPMGGIVLSGVSRNNTIQTQKGAGGVIIGGSSPMAGYEVGSGGAIISGQAGVSIKQAQKYFEIGTGGAKVNGSIYRNFTQTITSAGLRCAGKAIVTGNEMALECTTTAAAYGYGKVVYFDLNGTVNVLIDWGDGTKSTVTDSGRVQKIYASVGTFEIQIFGQLTEFGFNRASGNYTRVTNQFISYDGRDRITKVLRWGKVSPLKISFEDFDNLTQVPDNLPATVTDLSFCFAWTGFNQDISSIWDVSNVTNMEGTFFNNVTFNQPLNDWNTSNVVNMNYMFTGATAFNQSLNNWNVSNVTKMRSMFYSAHNFNQPLDNWDTSKVTDMAFMFAGTGTLGGAAYFEDRVYHKFNQNINSWNVANVTDMQAMFSLTLNFDQPLNNWNVSKVTNMGTMFADSQAFNQPLNNWDVTSLTHTGFGFLGHENEGMFAYSNKFNQPLNSWNVSKLADCTGMFYGAKAFNQPLDQWNTSSIVAFTLMFAETVAFNESLANWVFVDRYGLRIGSMFYGAQAFNHPSISNWDVSNIKSVNFVFTKTKVFNQPLNSWNVSNVTSMGATFAGAKAFNQPLNNWDISNVTSIESMFASTTSFNQDINSWNVSNVTSMNELFYGASAFNQPLNNWNTSKVIEMRDIFASASSFNQDINNWDVSNVTDMSGAFAGGYVSYTPYVLPPPGSSFNQPLNNWNTSKVVNMNDMFNSATAFNQDIGAWNTSNVTFMVRMFAGATAFNQDISSWNFRALSLYQNSSLTYFLYLANNFSTTNWDLLLNAWNADKANLINGILNIRCPAKYSTAAATARNNLITTKSWTIVDGGPV